MTNMFRFSVTVALVEFVSPSRVARPVFFLQNWATFQVLLLVTTFLVCGSGVGRASLHADVMINIYLKELFFLIHSVRRADVLDWSSCDILISPGGVSKVHRIVYKRSRF